MTSKPDLVQVGNLEFERSVLMAYMVEQYEAAREHSAAHREMIAFLFATASVLALEAMKAEHNVVFRLILSGIVVSIGIYAHCSGKRHQHANRLHSETATACRKLLSGNMVGKHRSCDPIIIRRSVEKLQEQDANPSLTAIVAMLPELEEERNQASSQVPQKAKIGVDVGKTLSVLPVLIMLTGLALVLVIGG